MGKQHTHNWQKIIWREWRNCQDKMRARNLFELVADAPVGLGTKATAIFFNTIVGMTGGLAFGFIFTSEWAVLRHLVWAGGIVGLARGFGVSRRLSWRAWLKRLSFNLPTTNPSSGLGAILGLSLMGGLVFGPVVWLVLAGLFWSMGGLIQWLNRGPDSSIDPFDYQAWYFWWPKRPNAAELEAALEQLFHSNPAAQEVWSHPLQILEEKQKPRE